jgi:hypothetical protein
VGTTVYQLSQTTEHIIHKQPNDISTNNRIKSSQTTEKASNYLYNSIILSIFAAKLSNKRKILLLLNLTLSKSVTTRQSPSKLNSALTAPDFLFHKSVVSLFLAAKVQKVSETKAGDLA